MRQKKKSWSTRWKGHTIVVENWFDWRLRNGENAFVDGDLVCEHRSSWNTRSVVLEAEIHDESGWHQLKIYLGSANGFSIDCHIYVNDELVGGDTDKKLILPAASAQALSIAEQRKQLKHELFYRAVVAPLILIPFFHAIETAYPIHEFSFVLAIALLLCVQTLGTISKMLKLPRENPDKNSTPI